MSNLENNKQLIDNLDLSLISDVEKLDLLKEEIKIDIIKGYVISKIKNIISKELRTQHHTQLSLNKLMLNLNIFGLNEESIELFYNEARESLILINQEKEKLLSLVPQTQIEVLPEFKELKAAVDQLLSSKTRDELEEILVDTKLEDIVEEPNIEQKIEAVKVISLFLQTDTTFYKNLNNPDFKTTLEMTNQLGITCIKLLEIQSNNSSPEDNSILIENLETFYKGFLSLISFCNTNSFEFNSRSAFPLTFNGFAKSIEL